jgi:hypothetical protein
LAPAAGKVYLETKKERCKKLCTFKTFPETHHCTTKRSLAPKYTRGPKQQSPNKLLESPELGTRVSCLKENGKTLPLRIRPNSTPPKRLQKRSRRRRERRRGEKPKTTKQSKRRRRRRRKRETHLNPNCKAKQKKEGRSLDPELQSRAEGGGRGGGNQTCNCNQETATKNLRCKTMIGVKMMR